MPSHRMPAVELPRDELQHRSAEHEWWYFFAVLRQPATGARFHYTTALMRRGIAWVSYYRWWETGSPPTFRRALHRGPTVHSATEMIVAPASSWRVRLSSGRSTHRLGAVADLHFSDDVVGAFLHTRAADGGIRHYGGANEMAWYSWPRLKVHGVLAGRSGDRAQLEGFGWMEHQWGNTDFTRLTWRYLPILLDAPQRALIALHYRHEDADSETFEVAELVDGEARTIDRATMNPLEPGGTLTTVLGENLDLSCRAESNGVIDLGLPGVPRFSEAPSIVYGPDNRPIGVAMTEYSPSGAEGDR